MVQNGYKVVINYYTDEATALETKRELELEYPDSQIMTYKANVGSESEVSAMVAKVVEKFGSVNILINNAGINVDSISWKMEKDSWDRVIATNLTGAFLCTKHVLPIMRQNNWGRIIFISSVVGQTGAFGASNYTASKAGLFGFAKSVAKEVANKNITVNVIACGYTTVGMGARLPEEISKKVLEKIPMGRFGTPEEIADLVLFLITASYITGQVIAIDGGLT
jgi:3-oxoacyl-[acyl-carrier protein] reductase